MFSQLNSPPRLYPCLRFTVSLAVAAQDSGPSGSLLLSRKNFPFSALCRFIPAHKYLYNAFDPCPKIRPILGERYRLLNEVAGATDASREAGGRSCKGY